MCTLRIEICSSSSLNIADAFAVFNERTRLKSHLCSHFDRSLARSIWISVLEVTLKEIHRCVADACLLSLLLPLTAQRSSPSSSER